MQVSLSSTIQARKSITWFNTRSEELEDERRRIYNVFWPATAVLMSIQALTAPTQYAPWKFIYVILMAASFGASLLLARFLPIPFSYSPIMAYMVLTPILFQVQGEHPWFSYGLVIVAMTISVSDIQIGIISIPLIIFFTSLQYFVVNRWGQSITDDRDILLLHGYFSTLWAGGFGLYSYFILREYLSRASQQDAAIQDVEQSLITRVRNIHRLNRRDYRNIRLHGTLLNTLNGALLNKSLLKNSKELAAMVRKDVQLLSNKPTDEREIRNLYNEILLDRKIQIVSNVFPWGVSHRIISAQILEIIREIILNIEKHTDATTARVTLTSLSGSRVELTVTENSLLGKNTLESENLVNAANRSRTLKRLIDQLNAKIEISESPNSRGIEFTLVASTEPEQIDPSSQIFQFQLSAISFFTRSLIHFCVIYGVLCIPAMIRLHTNPLPLTIFALSVFFGVVAILKPQWVTLCAGLGAGFAVIGFAVTALPGDSCEYKLYIPWIFNYAFGAVLLSAIEDSNRIRRWIPLALFTAECLVLTHFYPSDCHDLLTGSTPIIPVIVLMALGNIRERKRDATKRAEISTSLLNDREGIAAIENFIDGEFTQLLQVVEDLATSLESNSGKNRVNEQNARLTVGFLRTYLLCSEHFDSALVRSTYIFAKRRFENGLTTPVELYGEGFLSASENSQLEQFFNYLSSKAGDRQLSLLMLSQPEPELVISGDPDLIEALRKSRAKALAIDSVKLSFRDA